MPSNSATNLSIIIPTYNRSECIARSVRSYMEILTEKCAPNNITFECIVINDGSGDATDKEVSSLKGEYPGLQLISLAANQGPGPARDAGVDEATGEWIWFLDDDDELNPETLPHLLSLIKRDDLTADIVAHSLKRAYSDNMENNRLEVGRNILRYQEKKELFNYVFRKSMLARHPLRFGPGVHEDIPYTFSLVHLSNGVTVIPERIVIKNLTEGAITWSMTAQRIDGYIEAFNILDNMQARESELSAFFHPRDLFNQTLGVILYLIEKEDDDIATSLLKHLNEKCKSTDAWSKQAAIITECDPEQTNFKYAGSLWSQSRDTDFEAFLGKLRAVFQTRLSCKDLDASLFLGPDEIRACCKRFFVAGRQKGDVVLLKAEEGIDLRQIQAAKDDLIQRINEDNAPECSGCPYIERRDLAPSGIDYISLENFSYCNMRCTYCSPKYYGGTEARYNAASIIAELADTPNSLGEYCHVVWGGGEPTLSPRFEAVNSSLKDLAAVKKIRVLTNSLKHSSRLKSLLKDPRFQIVTSLDAGTQELFREIRGKGKLETVIANLKSYYDELDDKRRMTLKYILMPNNSDSHQLKCFVDEVHKADLMDAMFHISCDFTLGQVSRESVAAMYELAVRLKTAGASYMFFDDLIRDRVTISADLADHVSQHLSGLGLDQSCILKPDSGESVVLWGVGLQSSWYKENTMSGKSGRIQGVVANAEQWQSLERTINLPKVSVFPSGVQSMYEIIRSIEASGLGSRMYQGVIL